MLSTNESIPDNIFLDITSLSPLYEAVQLSGIFPDSKFFPDCSPKSKPADILIAYEQAKNQSGFDLRSFVATHFEFPETPDSSYQSANKPIREHLNNLWDVLLRNPNESTITHNSTLITLPYPYIVPGGRFREVYYWDSYFTMLGLQVSGRAGLIQNMVDNFAYLIETFGYIPNGNRSYYLSRSQPPFFALMVNLLAEIKGEKTLLQNRLVLEKEYEFWMDGEVALTDARTAQIEDIPALVAQRRVAILPDGSILNRYWDDEASPRPEAYVEDRHTAQRSDRPAEETYRHLRAAAESGWDFSSRWLGDEQNLASIRTCDLLPVDLNCLLYYLEKTLVHTYRQLPDHTPVEVYKDRARLRRAAILEHCWDEKQGFFFDFNHVENQRATSMNLAGVFPLFFHIATPEQAASVAKILEEKFLRPGGLLTTLSHSGQQWDAPNGWAPLQWMAYKGLMNYGHSALAEKIRQNWLSLGEKTYAATGKMMEKYNVENPDAPGGGGEYPNQDGFGWTNGVFLKMQSQ
ncbi:MAG: alpha,alpha-trehalase TreF [Saprospiraceae bacterium]|nr:alpha,alpha-trehalase TreF [Saprospiraceae bacterium]